MTLGSRATVKYHHLNGDVTTTISERESVSEGIYSRRASKTARIVYLPAVNNDFSLSNFPFATVLDDLFVICNGTRPGGFGFRFDSFQRGHEFG